METAAVGFRVKSGWAVAVLLAGSSAMPRVIDRRKVQLADPEIPASFQPYHEALDVPAREGAVVIKRLLNAIEVFSDRSVGELLANYSDGNRRILGVGVVVGSDVDPATIKNDHIRAHAAEGRLFRSVIEGAAKRCGLPTLVVVEKELLAAASKTLRRSERQLKENAVVLGRGLEGGWRAEEKSASLAAWMVLAS